MKKFFLATIAICSLSIIHAHAQDESNADAQCFSFEDALFESTRIDPRIDGAKAERDVAAANLMASMAQTRPQLSAFAQFGDSSNGLLQNNSSDNEVGIRLQQNLFNFGAFKLSQLGANEQLKASEHNISQIKETVAQEIATAYLELLRSTAIVTIAQNQENYYREDALTADRRLDGQIITLSDASQIKANYALATSQRIDAVLSRDQAKSRLEILLDLKFECPSSVSAYFAETEAFLNEETLDSLVSQALSNAPALKRSRSRTNAARASSEESNRAGLPVVSLTGFVSFEEDTRRNSSFQLEDFVRREERIGINITSQLFSGGQNRARQHDARARLRGAKSDAASVRASIEDSVTRAWIRVQSQKNAQVALADATANLKTQLDATKLEYDAGRRTLSEVVRAAEAYYETASQASNLRYQYYNNLMLLRAAAFGLSQTNGAY